MLISFTRIMGGSLAMQSQRYARNGSGDHTKRADNCVNAERQYERNYEKKAKERQEVRRKGYWRLSVLEPLEWDNAFSAEQPKVFRSIRGPDRPYSSQGT